MGRYLSLTEVGIYGLVSGSVTILMTVIGFRLDYIVSRELVGATPAAAMLKMRDQAVVNFIGYGVLLGGMLAFSRTFLPGVDTGYLVFIFLLSVLENFAANTFANMTSLGFPLSANVVYFIRSALWVFPVIFLGLGTPRLRSTLVILVAWTSGIVISLIVTIWAGRRMPWHLAWHSLIDWQWVRVSLAKCSLIWIGSIGITSSFFIDRFFVAGFLGLDLAGVSTFYASFAAALYALVAKWGFGFCISEADPTAATKEFCRVLERGEALGLAGYCSCASYRVHDGHRSSPPRLCAAPPDLVQ